MVLFVVLGLTSDLKDPFAVPRRAVSDLKDPFVASPLTVDLKDPFGRTRPLRPPDLKDPF